MNPVNPVNSEHTIQCVMDLHRQGLSVRNIAIAMGWGPEGKNRVSGILGRLREKGLIEARESPFAKKFPPELAMKILDRLRENRSVRSIVREFRVHEHTVARIRTENNLPVFRATSSPKARRMPTIVVPAQNVIQFPVQPRPQPKVAVPGAQVFGLVKCCQWPGASLGKRSHIFCNDPNVVPGKPYCAKHCAEAYVPRTVRTEPRHFSFGRSA